MNNNDEYDFTPKPKDKWYNSEFADGLGLAAVLIALGILFYLVNKGCG